MGLPRTETETRCAEKRFGFDFGLVTYLMANRKSSSAFQQAIDGVRMLPLSPPKGGSKPIFRFFGIKFNFNRIKSATKFCCVKTSSSKVVEQSISYEITEQYRTESVSFHLKYWLKLTYHVIASEAHAVSAMTWCLKYSADNCTMNISDVGTARCSRTVSLR